MKQLTAFVLLGVSVLASAQTDIRRTFDFSPSYDAGHKILPADGGGYTIYGNRRQNATDTQRDLFLLRVNAQGEQVAYNTYGESSSSEGSPEGMGIAATTNGWILAADRKQSTIGTPSQAWMLRVNTAGTVLWSVYVPFSGLTNIAMTDIKPLPGGGFIACGFGFSSASRRMVALKISDAGVVEWSQKYDFGSGMGLYVSPGGSTCIIAGGNRIWKIRCADGSLVWDRTLVPPAYSSPTGTVNIDLNCITPTADGQFAVAGMISNDDLFEYNSAYYLAAWTESGAPLWERISHSAPLLGYGFNEATAIQYLPNAQELLIGGTADGQLLLSRIDLKGNEKKTKTVVTTGEFFSPCIVKNGPYYAATCGILTSGINVNTFFWRSAGNSLDLQAPGNTQIMTDAPSAGALIFPNPATERMQVEFESSSNGDHLFRLIDAAGRTVQQQSAAVFAGQNRLEFDLKTLAPGTYWLSADLPEWTVQPVRKQ